MSREKRDDFSFEIRKHIGVIATNGSGWTKELNLVSWNGAAPKYDIRDWDGEHLHMGRGLTLKENEMRTLIDLASEYGVGSQNEGEVDTRQE